MVMTQQLSSAMLYLAGAWCIWQVQGFRGLVMTLNNSSVNVVALKRKP